MRSLTQIAVRPLRVNMLQAYDSEAYETCYEPKLVVV